jgi:hypothetical protein
LGSTAPTSTAPIVASRSGAGIAAEEQMRRQRIGELTYFDIQRRSRPVALRGNRGLSRNYGAYGPVFCSANRSLRHPSSAGRGDRGSHQPCSALLANQDSGRAGQTLNVRVPD